MWKKLSPRARMYYLWCKLRKISGAKKTYNGFKIQGALTSFTMSIIMISALTRDLYTTSKCITHLSFFFIAMPKLLGAKQTACYPFFFFAPLNQRYSSRIMKTTRMEDNSKT